MEGGVAVARCVWVKFTKPELESRTAGSSRLGTAVLAHNVEPELRAAAAATGLPQAATQRYVGIIIILR